MAIEIICPQCGKQHKVKRKTKVYCSALCRTNAYHARQRAESDETKMTMVIGEISLNFVGLNPATDKEKLKADLLALLAADGFLAEIENFDTSLMTRPFPELYV